MDDERLSELESRISQLEDAVAAIALNQRVGIDRDGRVISHPTAIDTERFLAALR